MRSISPAVDQDARPRRDRQYRRDAEGVDHRRPAHQLAADSCVERRPPRGGEATGEGTRRADHHARQHARRAAAQRGCDEAREDLARDARQGRRHGLVGQFEQREFVQPERRRRRSYGSNSTGASGTPPLPSGGLGSSSTSSPLGGAGTAPARTAVPATRSAATRTRATTISRAA